MASQSATLGSEPTAGRAGLAFGNVGLVGELPRNHLAYLYDLGSHVL